MTSCSIQDVLCAVERLRGQVKSTPLVRSTFFDGWLKLECLQHTGAYKVRGALNAMMKKVAAGDHRTVVAASAGNHAAGVAFAAKKLGLRAITVVPEPTPRVKTDRTRALGAQVLRFGADFEAAYEKAIALSMSHDWHFLHPFDDRDVIAGQGSVAAEILPLRPDVVAIPIGGGGLAAGMGTLLKAHGVRVVGVQVNGVNAMERRLKTGVRAFFPNKTIADGVRVQRVGALSSSICADVLDDIVLVEEADVRRVMGQLALMDHVVAEGAGAVAVAGLAKIRGRKKVAIVSGGNVDPCLLNQVMVEAVSRQGPRTARCAGATIYVGAKASLVRGGFTGRAGPHHQGQTNGLPQEVDVSYHDIGAVHPESFPKVRL